MSHDPATQKHEAMMAAIDKAADKLAAAITVGFAQLIQAAYPTTPDTSAPAGAVSVAVVPPLPVDTPPAPSPAPAPAPEPAPFIAAPPWSQPVPAPSDPASIPSPFALEPAAPMQIPPATVVPERVDA